MIGQCHALAYIVQLQCTFPSHLVPLIYKAPNIYNIQRRHDSRLQRDLALPCALGQTQRLNAVLPPRPTPLLPPQILQQLLPPVNQQPQIALVVLVTLTTGGEEIRKRLDLGGEDGNLYLGRARVRADALAGGGLVGGRTHGRRGVGVDGGQVRGAGWQGLVGVVAAEGLDAAGDIDAHAVLAGAVGQGGDARNSLGGAGVVGLVLGFDFVCRLLGGPRGVVVPHGAAEGE